MEGPVSAGPENLKELCLMRISVLSRFALVSVVGALAFAAGAVADTQTENVYVDGQTYAINTGAAVVFDASPGLLEQSSPMFLIGFTVLPGTTGPIILPSGYQPQNNGLPSPVPYHDHVLSGAPGLGTSGTAGDYGASLQIVRMQYTLAYTYDPAFVPITSVDQIAAAAAAGKLLVLNAGPSVRSSGRIRKAPSDIGSSVATALLPRTGTHACADARKSFGPASRP